MCFLFLFTFPCMAEDYKTVLVEIPNGSSVLVVKAYVFNELSTGKEITENIFGFRNFEKMVRPEYFKKLDRMQPDSRLHGYNYAIIRTDNEFWILKNYEDAYIYGSGFYTY